MKYEELHTLSNKFNEALKHYAIRNDSVNNEYFLARVFIDKLTEKSFKNKELRNEFGKWLKYGGTIRLKNVLRHVKYDDSELIHFNAMCLIDAVHACS